MDLHAATDKLQLDRSSAADIESVVNWLEYVKATGAVVGIGSQRVKYTSSGSAGGDMLDAPGASNGKKITSATWRNKHASTPNTIAVLLDQNGTDYEIHRETLQAGETLEYIEDIGFFVLRPTSVADLWKILTADAAGQNIGTVQPWFPTAGGVLVEAGTIYEFQGVFSSVRAAGATSHTTGFGFGGSATLTQILSRFNCGEGDVATLADDDAIIATSAANLQVKAASTSTTEVIKLACWGTVVINAAGTFIPQFTYSAAPGGAPTIEAGTRFNMVKRSAAERGVWA